MDQQRERVSGSQEGDPRAVEGLAAETARGSDSKARHPERLARFHEGRLRNLAMGEHIAKSDQRLAFRRVAAELNDCCTYLVFRWYVHVDAVRLYGMRSCRMHLLCPSCAVRRGARYLASYCEKFQQLKAERPSLVAQMITLTVRNGDDLSERFAHLSKCVRRWFKYRHLGRGSESEKVVGAVWSFEAKRGQNSGLWHPHVHMFALVDPVSPVSPELLSAEWRNITGDSFVLDVHDVYGDPVEAFCEVFKYAVKFGGLPLDDNLSAYIALKGRRLIASSGIFRGVVVPESLTDDLLENEDVYVDILWRHFGALGYRQVGAVGSSAKTELLRVG